jgi:hypothetical protein
MNAISEMNDPEGAPLRDGVKNDEKSNNCVSEPVLEFENSAEFVKTKETTNVDVASKGEEILNVDSDRANDGVLENREEIEKDNERGKGAEARNAKDAKN